jgi:hypothetical protein
MDAADILNSYNKITKKLQPNQELLENHQQKRPLEKRTLISQLNVILMMFSEFARAQGLLYTWCQFHQHF